MAARSTPNPTSDSGLPPSDPLSFASDRIGEAAITSVVDDGDGGIVVFAGTSPVVDVVSVSAGVGDLGPASVADGDLKAEAAVGSCSSSDGGGGGAGRAPEPPLSDGGGGGGGGGCAATPQT